MKKLFLALCVVALTACTPGAKEIKPPVLPDGLSDCSFFYVNTGNLNTYTVVRCPNSSTSTTHKEGKSTKSVIVVDGKEYIEKDAK